MMVPNITIGQYIPGKTVIHHLDPRTKFIIVFCFMLIVFMTNNMWTYVAIISFTLTAYWAAQIPLRFVWKGLKPVWIILLFTFVFHLWLTREGVLLWEWGLFAIYEGGLQQAVTLTVRIAVLVLMASLLTFTTKPLVLTDGLETMFKPLQKWRLPVHEFALMMSIALRFIPTLMQELDKLMKAQAARGAGFTSGPLWRRIYHLVPVLVPLFISSFQRADELATAMEARAYQGGEGRTQLRVLTFQKVDFLVFGFSLLFFILILWLRTW